MHARPPRCRWGGCGGRLACGNNDNDVGHEELRGALTELNCEKASVYSQDALCWVLDVAALVRLWRRLRTAALHIFTSWHEE
jgi:hypothetical protein